MIKERHFGVDFYAMRRRKAVSWPFFFQPAGEGAFYGILNPTFNVVGIKKCRVNHPPF
ncbi:MAG TPA: hypothetical protein PK613_15420 [Anaerolineaceae bacterium]|nr:hypothetical protein [Anaerolineaceae bacterium]